MSDQSWTLRLPFVKPPVSANDARDARHWGSQWAAKIAVEQAVVAVVKQAGIPPLPRCAVEVIWYAKDYGVRDDDGLYVMLKAARDALCPPKPAVPAGTLTKAGTPRKKAQRAKVGAGIIPDDSARYVESSRTAIVLGDPDPRIELVIHAREALVVPGRKQRRAS